MRDLSDPISRQQTITALRALSDDDGYINAPHEVVTDVVRGLPPVKAKQGQTTQPEQGESDKLGGKTGKTCEDCISRQAAISAICNACGKIDCDKMDKCEKLQLPPANCSEFPNNSDTISRQAAIDKITEYGSGNVTYMSVVELKRRIEHLPSTQPETHEKRTETRACDCISRQAAKEAVRMVFKDLQTRTEINILINDLPSVTPERKTGKWIDGKRMKKNDGTFYWFRQCDQCGYERNDCDTEKDSNFCPDCGADMREGQDEQRK